MSRHKRRWITLKPTETDNVLRAQDIPYNKVDDGTLTPGNDFGTSPEQYGGPGKSFVYENNGDPVNNIRTIKGELDLKPYAPENTLKNELVAFENDTTGWPQVDITTDDDTLKKVTRGLGIWIERYYNDLDGVPISSRFATLSGNWNSDYQARNELYVPTQSQVLYWARDLMGFVRGPEPYTEDDPSNPGGTRTYQDEIMTFNLGLANPDATDFNNDQYQKNVNPTKESGRFSQGSGGFLNREGDLKSRSDVFPSEKVIKDQEEWIELKNLAEECRYVQRDFNFAGRYRNDQVLTQNQDCIEKIYGQRFYWRLPKAKIVAVYAADNGSYDAAEFSITINGTLVNFTPGTTLTVDTNIDYTTGLVPTANNVINEGNYVQILNRNANTEFPRDFTVSLKIEILGPELT